MSDTDTTTKQSDPSALANTEHGSGVDINDLIGGLKDEIPSSEQPPARRKGSTLASLVAELTKSPAFTFTEQYRHQIADLASSLNQVNSINREIVGRMSGIDEMVSATAKIIGGGHTHIDITAHLFEPQSLLSAFIEQVGIADKAVEALSAVVRDQTHFPDVSPLFKSLPSDFTIAYIKQITDAFPTTNNLLATGVLGSFNMGIGKYLEQIKGFAELMPGPDALGLTQQEWGRVLGIGDTYAAAISKAIVPASHDFMPLVGATFVSQDLLFGYTGLQPNKPLSQEVDVAYTWRQTELQIAEENARREQKKQSHRHLLKTMTTTFGKADIKTICFLMAIDYDEIRGEGKEEKIIELIEYTERHDWLSELVIICKELRPNHPWPDPTTMRSYYASG